MNDENTAVLQLVRERVISEAERERFEAAAARVAEHGWELTRANPYVAKKPRGGGWSFSSYEQLNALLRDIQLRNRDEERLAARHAERRAERATEKILAPAGEPTEPTNGSETEGQ